ncbi:MAG: hypothetical protein HKN04_06055 [Rhodothermaceae bacterium]|nr:hypothetical protein [Rhodothermaceae bacterium]
MPNPREVSYDTVADVALHYARPPVAPYGSRGRQFTFFSTRTLRDTFAAALDELADVCPHGRPEVLTSAGTFVSKPGQHGKGQAIDVDAIFWSDRTFVTDFYLTDTRFYLAVESVFRRHFGLVLNYLYNNAHHDHLHMDLGVPVGFSTGSRSRVLYVQASLTHVHDRPVLIDGIWGNQTAGAIDDVLSDLGLTGSITNKNTWLAYLDRTARLGFGQAETEADPTPADLLDQLFQVIDGLDLATEHDHKIQGALDLFVAHPDTMTWLDTFREGS